ncbi:hypothetical protein T439DRAFT_330372 [Meredithblackwellia eburnea MCA 4105]
MALKLDLKTTGALLVFALVLAAYTTQTELAQYVQHSQGYRKPYFLLWMTHSGYALILPFHFLALRLMGVNIPESLSILRGVFRIQFASESTSLLPDSASATSLRPPLRRPTSRSQIIPDRPPSKRRTSLRRLMSRERSHRKLWKWRLLGMVVRLTVLIAFPALTWYAAVPLTSMTNITAIYNVFAFWAYLLAIKFLDEEPSRVKLLSVVLAVCGVFTIAYGDSMVAKEEDIPGDAKARMAGNILALVGSISYAWYEVWYKLNASLPETPDDENDDDLVDEVDALLAENDNDEESSASATGNGGGIKSAEGGDEDSPPPNSAGTPAPSVMSVSTSYTLSREVTHPSTATFLLHANVITGLIGVCTFTMLWVPIPFLHWIGWENFDLPPKESVWPIAGIILSGVFFNAGFMILLSLWGPVVASVGNLCTLVLVAIADTLLSPEGTSLSKYTLGGGAMVCGAFAILVFFRGEGGH